MFRCGSKADVLGSGNKSPLYHSLKGDIAQRQSRCPLSAISGLMKVPVQSTASLRVADEINAGSRTRCVLDRLIAADIGRPKNGRLAIVCIAGFDRLEGRAG